MSFFRCTHFFYNGKSRFFLLFSCTGFWVLITQILFSDQTNHFRKRTLRPVQSICLPPHTIRQVSEKHSTSTLSLLRLYNILVYYKKITPRSQGKISSFFCFLCLLPQCNIQDHHKRKSNCYTYRSNIRMCSRLRLRNKLLYHYINHCSCCKSQ